VHLVLCTHEHLDQLLVVGRLRRVVVVALDVEGQSDGAADGNV
jgi:hypothetical protein